MRRPTLCCAIADNGSRCRRKAVRDATVRVDTGWCSANSDVHREAYVQVPLCRRHEGLRYYDDTAVPRPGGGAR